MRQTSLWQNGLPAAPIAAALIVGLASACDPGLLQAWQSANGLKTGPCAVLSPDGFLYTPDGGKLAAGAFDRLPDGSFRTKDGKIYQGCGQPAASATAIATSHPAAIQSVVSAPPPPPLAGPIPCPTPGGQGSLYWNDGTTYAAGQWDYLWARNLYASYDGKTAPSCNGIGFAAVWSPFEVERLDDGSLKLVDGTILAPGRYKDLGNGLYQADWGTYYLGQGTMSQALPSIAPLPPASWRQGRFDPSPSASPSAPPVPW